MLGPNRFGLGFGPPPDPSNVTMMSDFGVSLLWASVAAAITTSPRRRVAHTFCGDRDKGNLPLISDFEQVATHDDSAGKARPCSFDPHAFGDLLIVGRNEVREHERLDARCLRDSTGVL